MARLGDVGLIITGRTPSTGDSKNYASNDICFIKPSDIRDNELTDLFSSEYYISEYARSQTRIVPPGSVLVTCIGIVGKVAINTLECAFNQQINAIIPNKLKCDCRYLAYALLYEKPRLQNASNAPVVPILNKSQFSEIEIPLPPLDEQRKIAAVLDKVSDLIAKRRQQLDKLDTLVKARFVEMFGDSTNPMGWPIHRLCDYIEFLTSGSRGWAKYFTDAGEYFITIKNVKNCRLVLDDIQHVLPPNNAEAKRTKVREGDLLISITADLGRTGVVTKQIAEHGGYINQHLTCVRLKKDFLKPIYVAYYMESEAGKIQFDLKNQNGVKAGLNFSAINSLEILVPPLKIQSEFVYFVERIENIKSFLNSSLDKLNVLRKILLQVYFA